MLQVTTVVVSITSARPPRVLATKRSIGELQIPVRKVMPKQDQMSQKVVGSILF